MEKYIYDQNNGLWYELQGDYYIPCLVLDETDTQPIGMWGRRHLSYLREHRPVLHTSLVLSGKLHRYLAEVDNRATEMLDRLVKQMAAQQARVNAEAEVNRQFAELQKAEPGIKDIDELMADPTFVAAFRATRDMTKAYRMAHVDEIEARAKGAAAAGAASGKDHLRRVGTRGAGAPMITQDVIAQYRLFDPDISVEEIRAYEAKYQKTRKK